MSYQTYTTEALVCGSFDNNTADRSFLLFTKRAGMLYANARSVREERSRQRYSLQDFSLITISLIKGKSGWRVGSVESQGNLFTEALTRDKRGSVVRLIKLVRRFVQGEEINPKLYDEFLTGITFLATVEDEDRTIYENLIVARLLYLLGYIAPPPSLLSLLDGPLESLNKTQIKSEAKTIIHLLDNAQKVSHL